MLHMAFQQSAFVVSPKNAPWVWLCLLPARGVYLIAEGGPTRLPREDLPIDLIDVITCPKLRLEAPEPPEGHNYQSICRWSVRNPKPCMCKKSHLYDSRYWICSYWRVLCPSFEALHLCCKNKALLLNVLAFHSVVLCVVWFTWMCASLSNIVEVVKSVKNKYEISILR